MPIKQRGAYVAILDMNVEAGEAIARDIGERATFFRCDVRSEEDVNSAITAVDTLWGLERTVGGVVHCGGVGMAGLTVNSKGEPFSLDVFREVVDINLTGSFNIASKIAAKIVRSNPRGPSASNPTAPEITEDRGVIILVSSVSYEEGQQGQTAYGSSKAGVVGLLLPMARDLSRFGIRVCGVAPSLFSTAMGKNTSDKVRESLLESTLFPHRFGKPFYPLACIWLRINRKDWIFLRGII